MRVNIKSILGYFSILIPTMIIFSYGFFAMGHAPYPVCMIAGTSMEPTLSHGDIVIWIPVEIENVEKNDIIIFRSTVYEGRIVAHRVVNVTGRGGGTMLETKGDANPYPDQRGPHSPEPYIRKDNFLGKLVCVGDTIIKFPSTFNPIFIHQIIQESEPGLLFVIGILVFIIIGVSVLLYLNYHTPKITDEELFFGVSQSGFLKIVFSIFVMFLLFSLITANIFYTAPILSLGVNEDLPDDEMNIEITPGETKTENFTFTSTGVIPMRGMVFAHGKNSEYINIGTPVFSLSPNEKYNYTITASVPDDAKSGVYNYKLYTFFSPLWLILPTEVIGIFPSSIHGVICVYLLSSFVLTMIFSMILLVSNKFIEKYEYSYAYKSVFHRLKTIPKETK